jgi:serine/threonine protein kinase/tetratricopeptide (TPR) repeat protein
MSDEPTRVNEKDPGKTATATTVRPHGGPLRIGPYRLLDILGEGGMGVVYHAEQTEPVARRVALKIIKLGMDTKEVVARFDAERQALALMDHPAIARVYDAGVTEGGRPYFVMELVPGLPITDYCDRERLDTRERLGLFIQVCQAVQHAHQKGVIHRDLKPSNILVTIQDGKPVPKIIDFGIAKAMHRRLTDQTLVTHVGEIIGTPAFMSPEQLEGVLLDVDTRADIYSLGVTLYQLLTGQLPFDPDALNRSGASAAAFIRDHEPPRPSARVTTARSAKTLAENRRTDLPHLQRALRGDLDWIVLKAMARDRSRRYETTNGLALDIERHLRDEPVTARPPSAGYRAAKFVKRHRVGVAFAAVLATTLVVFAAATAVQGRRVAHERDRAEAAARKAAAVAQFLEQTLGAADPWQSGRDLSVREALEEAANGVEASFKDQPLVMAAVRRTLGRTYFGLGRYKESERLLRSALDIRTAQLGGDHPDVAESLGDLSLALTRLSRFDEAAKLGQQALDIRRRTAGAESVPVALALRQLGSTLFNKGDYAESERLLREALEIQRKKGPVDDKELATTLTDLAATVGQEKPAAGEALLREALAIRTAKQGPDHPETAQILNDLAVARLRQEDYKEAEALYKQALAANKRTIGDVHPETASTLENLGGVYYRTGRLDESLAALDEVLVIRRKGLGEDSLQVARTLQNIGVVQTKAGRLREAEASFEQALPRMRAIQGPDHPEIAQVFFNWARLKKAEKDYAAAEKLYRQCLELRLKKLGEEHPDSATARFELGSLLALVGRYSEAEPLLVAARDAREKLLGKDAAPTRAVEDELGRLRAARARASPSSLLDYRSPCAPASCCPPTTRHPTWSGWSWPSAPSSSPSTCSWWTTLRPTALVGSPTPSPKDGRTSRSCTGPARGATGRRSPTAFGRRFGAGRKSCSPWTSTSRTTPRPSLVSWRRSPEPTS